MRSNNAEFMHSFETGHILSFETRHMSFVETGSMFSVEARHNSAPPLLASAKFGPPSVWPHLTLSNPRFCPPSFDVPNFRFGQPSFWATIMSSNPHALPTSPVLIKLHVCQPSFWRVRIFANPDFGPIHVVANPRFSQIQCGQPASWPTPTLVNHPSGQPSCRSAPYNI